MLTKIFSAFRSPKPLDHASAWACLLSNALALPGLGSLLAGRRSGFFQVAVALVGFGLVMVWLISFAGLWIYLGEMPRHGGLYRNYGLLGLGMSVISWVWAFFTSLSILREAGPHQKPPLLQ